MTDPRIKAAAKQLRGKKVSLKGEWDHDHKMPFGMHYGTRLGDVPASYLRWCMDQVWIEERHPGLVKYLEKHKRAILEDAAQEQIDKQSYAWGASNEIY